MFWAVLITLVSVVGGTVLALVPRGRNAWMGPVRTFALTAALSVVILHLLPEALAEVGSGAIFVFLLGLVAPELLGKLGVLLWRAGRDPAKAGKPIDLALEASYFGLLLHRVGDGVGLGAFTGELHVISGSGGVITALAAHAVPVVAIVVLTFDSVRGRGSALKRAAGLAAASIVGVLLASSLPGEYFAAASGWLAAFVGGTLLHVVTHDLAVQLPSTAKARVIDLLAGAAGVYVSFLGRGAHHDHDEAHPVGHFEHALVEFAVETGPLLILGLAVGSLLTVFGGHIPQRFFRSRGHLADAARGTLVGAPLPLCSCSVLPISAALKGRGATPAFVVAFLLSTPELGVETFALSVRFLGWQLAWIRLGTALLVACGAAIVVSLVVRAKSTEPLPPVDEEALVVSTEHWLKRALHSFDELFQHIGAWMILGVVAAALLEVAVPADAFESLGGWPAQFAIISLVAVPSYVCAPSATPLAAVLLAKGLSPGAVLVGLLLGPATNIATIVFLRRWFGARAAWAGVASVVVLSWCLGMLVNLWVPQTARVLDEIEGHDHGGIWMVLAILSGVLLFRAFYRTGVRGFLSTLQGSHSHAHDSEAATGGHSHGGHSHGSS